MGFLPQNYEAPQTGGSFMRLQNGDNRIRILGQAITGKVFWTTDGDGGRKPVRRRLGEAIGVHELGIDQNGNREQIKTFLAFPVWNYATQNVQVLELTQATVLGSVEGLALSEDWGDPINRYDITISKKGSGLDTKYSIVPKPPAPTDSAIMDAFAAKHCNLEVMFDGGFPFDDGEHQQAGKTTAPANTVAPSGGNVTVRVASVTHVPAGGKDYWRVATDSGDFWCETSDKADTAKRFVNGSAVIGFVTTERGGKKVVSVAASGGAVSEDDIPFSPCYSFV